MKKLSLFFIFFGLLLLFYCLYYDYRGNTGINEQPILVTFGDVFSKDIKLHSGEKYWVRLWLDKLQDSDPSIEMDWRLLKDTEIIARGGTLHHQLSYSVPADIPYEGSSATPQGWSGNQVEFIVARFSVSKTGRYHFILANTFPSNPALSPTITIEREWHDPLGGVILTYLLAWFLIIIGSVLRAIVLVRKLRAKRDSYNLPPGLPKS